MSQKLASGGGGFWSAPVSFVTRMDSGVPWKTLPGEAASGCGWYNFGTFAQLSLRAPKAVKYGNVANNRGIFGMTWN